MLKIFKLKSEFSKNVLTLMTGTTIAQAIPIAITPILTRVYTPENFGIFALFIAVVTILSVIATGRYEFAILLPKKDKDAKVVLALSSIITTITSLILLFIVVLFNSSLTKILGNPEISFWLYFVPLAVFLNGVYQSLNYWVNRKKRYKVLANNRILQSGTVSSTNLVMGISGFSSVGLVVGQILGQFVATVFLVLKVFKEDNIVFKNISKIQLLVFLKRYKKFPKIDIPASLFNVSSHQLIHMFFNIMFSATIAGYFYLTQRILGIPVSVLSSAVLSVFQEQAAKEYKQFGHAREIFLSTFKKLFMLIVIPSIFFCYYAVDIFIFVFGEEWKEAGVYAQILTPMLFLQFIAGPLGVMLYIGEKQEVNFYTQAILVVLVIFSFLVGATAKDVVIYLSFSFSFFYIVQLLVSFRIAGFFKGISHG
ncbi:lipopolysaccharide biosynthesis protein [Arcobacter caeni]|uniref:Translocase n=1 Tax=Arcobacter caeni TaxID=1912877 RepID=A0A363CXK7_9BACT|nr:oligosaccharide flippase family protein [Arcobacter caeni]PUE63753.1 hypothetical protein B0174_09400 [Arcobacter caeni]